MTREREYDPSSWYIFSSVWDSMSFGQYEALSAEDKQAVREHFDALNIRAFLELCNNVNVSGEGSGLPRKGEWVILLRGKLQPGVWPMARAAAVALKDIHDDMGCVASMILQVGTEGTGGVSSQVCIHTVTARHR